MIELSRHQNRFLHGSSFRIERCLEDIVTDGINFIGQHIAERKSNPFFLYLPLTGPHTPWVPEDQFRGKSSVATYGDFILTIDNVVRVINDQINQLGIAENTMVIFASDNGICWGLADLPILHL